MEANYYVGIDIAQKTMDWKVLASDNHPVAQGQAGNSVAGIAGMRRRWTREGISSDQLIVCFEHTGPYGLLLAATLQQAGVRYVVVSASQVRLSQGIQRGKTDALDAARLAEYLWRFRDTLQESHLPSQALLELRSWLMWRERLVKMRTGLANAMQANQLMGRLVDLSQISQQMDGWRDQLNDHVRQADRKIQHIIRDCSSLQGNYKLLISIPGIGPLVAAWLLVYTQGFTRFSTGRQLACYVGSAPFPHRSGQQRSPDRVSRWRCARMKTLLLSGALSAIQHDPELGRYYRRKCAEGKHPQSVKNAVICKLIYRAFAVVNRGTPYVKIYQHQMVE